ncbi:Glycerol-3-phosphate dehydrogenase [NAD(P)+] [invertebrate metagenome]|uniref:Glycerol-3-phosphate dehydrogenase [NAD(P)+] n=1 Tax=invertebrate metagenome TaxID=1711999 RepID=A0A2H9TB67_9ZZZZ
MTEKDSRGRSATQSGRQGSMSVAVLGGGSFGTVLANIAAINGHRVMLWVRREEQASRINIHHRNELYLPNFPLHKSVYASSNYADVLSDAMVVLVAVPSQYFRQVVVEAAPWLSGKIVVSTTKGIEAETFDLMSEILQEELDHARIGVLSGPNLAREIAGRELTATVIASHCKDVQNTMRDVLHSDYFRMYASDDIYGVELAGALKNIYAIASGVGAAAGVGENTTSMLLTRSLAEMSRLAVRLGANPLTFLGLAGVGDLIATCTSRLSRNFRLGYALGEGKSLEVAEKELGQVAEGANTLKQTVARARKIDVDMPIAFALYRVMYEKALVSCLFRQMGKEEEQRDVEFMLGGIRT